MPRGSTPSLIGSSLGRPRKETCGRKTPCSRCKQSISKGEGCYDVPRPQKSHSSTRRFCFTCYRNVLEKTKADINALEEELADEECANT